MKRYVESFLIMLTVVCSCIFEWKSRSKTWFYPDYIIKDTTAEISLYWKEYLSLVLIIVILFILGMELVRRNKWKFAVIPFVACIALAALFGIRHQYSIGRFINEAEKLVMGTYVLICYGVAEVLENGMERKLARFVYLLFHICAVMFCSWSYIYEEIYISPVVVLYLSMIFLIVYDYVFQSEKPLVCKKVITSLAVVIGFTLILSFKRIQDILLSLGVTEELTWNNMNWLCYRKAVLQTMITGDYSDQILDPITMNSVKSFTMRWLGTAFGRRDQVIYILLLIGFLTVMLWMYYSKKKLFSKMVISAIIFSNFCGIVCEMNLFYSAEVGVLASRNLYQLIPVIFLAYVNLRREAVSGKVMIEMNYWGQYRYELTDGRIYLPRRFQMANKDMIMQVIDAGSYLYIQLLEEIPDEEWIKDEIKTITVLEEKKIHIDKDGFFELPEVYLNKVEITEDSDIIVLGVFSKVEVYITNRKTKDFIDDGESMISIFNTPGESL